MFTSERTSKRNNFSSRSFLTLDGSRLKSYFTGISFDSTNNHSPIGKTPKSLTLKSTVASESNSQEIIRGDDRNSKMLSSTTLMTFATHAPSKIKTAAFGNWLFTLFGSFKNVAISLCLLLSLTSGVYGQNIDIALKQTIDTTTPSLGDPIKYTVYLKNEGANTATGIVINDQIPFGAISNVTLVAQAGFVNYNATNGSIVWVVSSLAVGDSVKLEILANANARGVYFNVAEIVAADQNDTDSSPNNTFLNEDDIATACFSVPIIWYPGDQYIVSIPAPYNLGSGISWFKNNVLVDNNTVGAAVNPDSTLTMASPGSYTFQTSVSSCPASGCCPIVMIQGPYGSIGNYVWNDANTNGIQDVSEAALTNVKVYLLNNTGTVIDSTFSSGSGNYLFDSLKTGSYQIQFFTPSGYEFSLKDAGSNDALDSDANITTGKTDLINIDTSFPSANIQRDNLTVDAGIALQKEFDLALNKDIATAIPYLPGDTITYNLSVLNQGQLNATQVQIKDDFPAGLTLLDNNWTLSAGDAIYTIPVTINAGSFAMVPITFKINTNFSGVLSNAAEITSAKGPIGENITDKDSTPGNASSSEDDDDIEIITVGSLPIFDLAVSKDVASVLPYNAGSSVTYDIMVYNQGSVNATQVQITDKIPTGLTLSGNTWTLSSGNAVYTIPTTLNAGSFITVPITFTIGSNFSGLLTNTVEITSAKGSNGENVSDGDSTPGNNSTNEDDDDAETINVIAPQQFDLAINKVVATAAPFSAGQTITYSIQVQNQGDLNATGIKIADSVPTGLTLADNSWAMVSGKAVYNNSITVASGQITTIPITFTINQNFTGSITNVAEITDAKGPNGEAVTDRDSTPNNGILAEDDQDDAQITVGSTPEFDLSLSKTLVSTGTHNPGSTVTFSLMVTNQGNVNATLVEVADLVPSGLTLQDAGWHMESEKAVNNSTFSVAAGNFVTLNITFLINSNFTGSSIQNTAEIKQARGASGEVVTDKDSTPNNNSTNEDDNATATVNVGSFGSIGNFVWEDLDINGIQDVGEPGIQGVPITLERPNGTFVAGTFSAANGSYLFSGLAAGDYVVVFGKPSGYTATLANQGSDALDSDANPGTGESHLIKLSAGENNNSVDAAFYLDNQCYTITAFSASSNSICVGDSTGLQATASNGGNIVWYLNSTGGSPIFITASGVSRKVAPTVNTTYYAELTSPGNGCPNPRVAIAITVNPKPAKPSSVNLIEVCQGETLNLNNYILNGTTSTGGAFEWHVSNSSISALVANPTAVNPGTYYLFEKSGVGCYSDSKQSTVISKSCNQFVDLSLIKIADKRTVNANDIITYTVSVSNAGPDIATNVVLEDILPTGLTFVSSPDFTSNSGVLSVNIPSIAVNQTKILTYQTRVVGTGSIINLAEVKSADQTDIDSTPGNGSTVNEDDDDDEVITIISVQQIADLSVQKFVSDNTPGVGDVATYTIRVTNAGPDAATNVKVTDNIPAGLNYISSAGGDNSLFAANILTTTFNTIAVNQTVQFIVNATVVNSSGTITNRAEVTASDQSDPDSTPNFGANEDDDDSITLTVTATCNPTTPIISADKTQICLGQSTTLTATGCNGTVEWTNGQTGTSIIINPTVNTSYTAHCRVDNCVSVESNALNISVGSPSTPSISAAKNTICSGESVTITATSCNGTVNWSNGQTGLTINVSPTTTSTYSATCSVGACVSNSSNSVTVVVSSSQTPLISSTTDEICSGESVTLSATNCSSSVVWNTGSILSSITVNPTATTTYSVTCGTGNCSATSFKTITVGSKQIPLITASVSSICAGDSVVLTVTSCSSNILWSTGKTTSSIKVAPSATSTYTVLCGTGSCSGSASKTINVGNQEKPTITVSKNGICSGESVTLTATGCFEGISWSSGQSTAAITVSPTASTTYTATCQGGCGMSDSKEINVVSSTSAPVITASATQLCQAGNVTLTATGCSGTVNWSNGMTGASISVNVTASIAFTATCTNGSCTSVNSNTLNINIGNLAAPTITSNGSLVCEGSSVTLSATGCSGGTIQWSSGQTGASLSVSPTVQTTYTATCKVGNCTSGNSNSKVIEIITIPNAPVISANLTTICLGDSATLSGLGCEGTIKWSNNITGSSIKVNPTINTNYTAKCQIGACESESSASVEIKVGNPTAPVVTTTNATICAGASTTLQASGCTGTVVWSDGKTGSAITVSPTTTTSYTAKCNAGSCESVVSDSVNIVVTSSNIAAPTVKSLSNVCPVKFVKLIDGVTSSPVSTGGTFIFTTANSPNSPVVSKPDSIVASGVYYVFEKGTNGCFSTGSQIDVGIISCETTTNCQSNPATAIAGKDTTICLKEDFFQLNGSIGGAAQTATWTTSGTGTFTNSVNLGTKYYYSQNDVNSGSVVLTLTTNDPDNAGSCQAATSSFTITINAVKTKPTISTDKSPIICLGDSVTLTASQDAASYLWSTGQTTKSIVVKTIGNYKVKLVNANGCRSLSSDELVVTNMGGIASPSVNDLAKNVCPATSVNLISNVLSSPATTGGVFEFHTGIDPNSAIISNVTAVPAGDYVVFEKSNLGCYSNPSIIKVLINNCSADTTDAEVGITITGDKSSVSIGDEIVFTIKVTNNGPKTASEIAVENAIPFGITLVGTTPGLSLSGDKLITTISSLAVGQTKTFVYTGKVTKSGVLSNIAKIISVAQTDPIKSNNISVFNVECSTCQEICVSTALKADTVKQSNGTYNVKFTALVGNCGNVNLTGIGLTTNMASMFGSTATFTMVQQPTVNSESLLVPNFAFNGTSEINILKKNGSELAATEIDTVRWEINLIPNGTEGPYATNAIASGVGMTIFNIPAEVSDVSNDGTVIEVASSTPTVVKLYKTPSIGLALAIVDTLRQENGSLNVTYQALVKNNGALPLTNVIVSDTLTKTYFAPVTYAMVGTPKVNNGSSLVVNPNYNGNTDVNLTLTSGTLAVGKTDTILFVVNVSPNNITEFLNQAHAQGIGTLTAGGSEKVVDISNTGYNPDVSGAIPTKLNLIIKQTANSPCIGTALYVADTTKLNDGSFDITYHAIITNCGNATLTEVSLCDTLSADFGAPSVVVLKKAPSLGLNSTLKIDNSYDGINNTCMLDEISSSLAPGKTDTIKWTVNLTLNSNYGPFRKNVTATAKINANTIIGDISNDGMDPSPIGENPTVLNFNNLAPDLIGISKKLVSIEKVRNNVFDLVFQFNVKNYGILDFTGVQVQDNISQTFGNEVIIDSVKVFDVSTGFKANSNYTGKGLLLNMLVDSSSTLPRNSTKSLSLFVRVDISNADTSRFENMALAIGYQNGSSTDDLSTDGSNPDPDSDGTPENNSLPTLIDFGTVVAEVSETPLGIAKSVTDTVSIVDGSYQITYKVIIKNYGNDTLTNIQLSDSLSTVFGDSTDFALIGSPSVSTGSLLKLNGDFDGVTDMNFLVADTSRLLAGKSDTLIFKVKVRNNGNETRAYSNTIYGSAISDTVVVTDVSTVGLNPDSDGDNNPGNNNTPTMISLKSGKGKNPTNAAVLIPGGISPNGDNINDNLVIEGITEADEMALRIYNRWGGLVFETSNYKELFPGASDGWDGKANTGIRLDKSDIVLPDGTYFYCAESPNQALFDGKPYFNFLTIAGGTKK